MKKLKTLSKYNTPEGREVFMNMLNKRADAYRELINRGGGFLLRPALRDMKNTADNIRKTMPEMAVLIDRSRQQIEEIITQSKT